MDRAIRWILTIFLFLWLVHIVLDLTYGGARFLPPTILLWILVALGTAGLWINEVRYGRRDRLLAAGRCVSCGYDRRGLAADAKCPECGTVPAPASK